jgi:nicotinamidase-related amidase
VMDRFNGLDVPESLADALDARTLAFLVYDMQAGILSQIPDGDRVMSNVQRLLAVTRKRRVRTVFTRHYFMPTQLAGVFQLRQAKIWQGKAHPAADSARIGRISARRWPRAATGRAGHRQDHHVGVRRHPVGHRAA